MSNTSEWLPKHNLTADGDERRVGVEIELAGLDPEQVVDSVMSVFGGQHKRITSYEHEVKDSRLGTFTIELDASYMKAVGALMEHAPNIEDNSSLEGMAKELLTKAAEQFVPWELVTPPVPLSNLSELEDVVSSMREKGALGTRNSLRYAFGLHLNPELPDLGINTLLNYFRAYLCLYDWLAFQEQIDLSRKLTTYISHYNKDYIQKVIDPSYQPDQSQFIDDYIEANPSRNRSLDLLPLFAHLDEQRVRSKLKDTRIKKRPTLHYRMPNCDIDNPQWNLSHTWFAWLQVEKLAFQPQLLKDLCKDYQKYLNTLLATYDNQWLEYTENWLQQENA